MYASHYVIEEILKKWGNLDELKREFSKFSRRYPQDEELQKIYREFKRYLKKKEDWEKIKEKLESLKNIRRMDSSGGAEELPYADRRNLSEE